MLPYFFCFKLFGTIFFSKKDKSLDYVRKITLAYFLFFSYTKLTFLPLYCDLFLDWLKKFSTVVLNRGGAEPLGAAESSRGVANF